ERGSRLGEELDGEPFGLERAREKTSGPFVSIDDENATARHLSEGTTASASPRKAGQTGSPDQLRRQRPDAIYVRLLTSDLRRTRARRQRGLAAMARALNTRPAMSAAAKVDTASEIRRALVERVPLGSETESR